MIKIKTGLLVLGILAISATPAVAEDVSTSTLCKVLPTYKPDQSVNYTPGANMNGQMVVPGDLNKVLRNNYDAVEIPVEYNVLKNMNITVPNGVRAPAGVAMLRVYSNGRVKYNDQDITHEAQNLCTLRQPSASSIRVN
jgi:hypothetical protein